MDLKQYIKRGLKYVMKGQPIKHITANVVQLSPNELLKDKIAFVTGGTSGIGKAIALAMVNSGAKVIITGRSQERLKAAIASIKENVLNKDNIFALQMDNLAIEKHNLMLNDVVAKYGKIDILVNNAGVLGGEFSCVTEEEYDKILSTNLKSAYFLSKYVGTYMRDNGIQGNILNILSSSSLRPAASAYTISKWGLRGMTLGLAKTLAPYGITVNGLAPGPTATPMVLKDESKGIFFNNPLGRMATAEEIANMAVVLTSDMGKTIVGDIIYMTGGSGLITFDDVSYNF